jgi:anti-anti-sigma factor
VARPQHETATLSIEGEFDLASCRRAERALAQIPDRDVCLDLTKCTFIDSSGLMVIVGTYERLTREGRKLSVSGASGDVARIFELTGLVRLLTPTG